MNEHALTSAVNQVLADLGMSSDGVQVETAMGAPSSDSIQIRIPDGAGDSKAVGVELRDEDGIDLDENGVRQRLRQQLSSFKRIDEL